MDRIFAFILLLTTSAHAIADTTASDKTTLLTIGIRQDFFNNNGPEAFDWIQDAAREAGLALDIKPLPARRSLILATEGIIDGLAYRHSIIEEEYSSIIRVDVALGRQEYYVWVINSAKCIQSRENLSQKKPVGLKNTLFFNSLVYPRSLIGYEEVKHSDKILEMLKRERADYTVNFKGAIENLTQGTDIQLKTCLDKPLFSLPFYLYLHESKQHLIPQLEQALRSYLSKHNVDRGNQLML